MDKEGNDLADQLAKQGAINGENVDIHNLLRMIHIESVTWHQAQLQTVNNVAKWSQKSTNEDLIKSQKENPIIGIFYKHIEDPNNNPISEDDYVQKEDLRLLVKTKSQFSIQDGLLMRTSKNGIQQWVVPTVFRGLMLQHAHDAPTASHQGEKMTYELLRDYAYFGLTCWKMSKPIIKVV